MPAIERQRLADIHERSLAAGQAKDHAAYAVLNREFHVVLCAGGNNKALADTAHQLRLRAAPFRRFAFFNSERLTTSLIEHEAIVEAILKEDSEAAAAATNGHLTTSSVNALSVVDLKRAGDGPDTVGPEGASARRTPKKSSAAARRR